MSRQSKPARITARILSVSKIPYGKNELWKNDWNNFPAWPLGFMGIMTHTVEVYTVYDTNQQITVLYLVRNIQYFH
jgi:hypothetical protein